MKINSKKANIGIYGMGTMGISLARNFARQGYKVAITNRTIIKAKELLKKIEQFDEADNIQLAETLEDLISVVEKGPIILLISSDDPQETLIQGKSNSPIDDIIFNGSHAVFPDGKKVSIRPLVEMITKDHIIIDAGNSHPYGTTQRQAKLSQLGIEFLGMGVSGGEMGALMGPSLMPGGDKPTYEKVKEILESAAAKDGNMICCDWMGPGNAGHLVKTVHNGIEYAIMQAIAEAYWILKKGYNLETSEIQKIFQDWNQGPFESYLLEITVKILGEKHDGDHIVDQIVDKAGAKGTGKWTSQISADLDVPAGTIYSALEARQLSNKKATYSKDIDTSEQKNKSLTGLKKQEVIDQAKQSLYGTILIAYTQGFNILYHAHEGHVSQEKINLSKVATVWRAGCIIRSKLLKKFSEIFQKEDNLLRSDEIQDMINGYSESWKKSISNALSANLPYQVTTSALNYYNTTRAIDLPQNLIQAQRDLFGAHTFELKNQPGKHHHDWGANYSVKY